MATTDDKDLNEKRKRIATLQEQVTKQRAKREELIESKAKEAESLRLDAEIKRLESELETEKALTDQQRHGELPTAVAETSAATPASGVSGAGNAASDDKKKES